MVVKLDLREVQFGGEAKKRSRIESLDLSCNGDAFGLCLSHKPSITISQKGANIPFHRRRSKEHCWLV